MTAIIVFDGVCHLCNGWVRFLLKRDKAERFRFAPMQTAAGRRLLKEHGLDPDAPVSLLLLDEHRPYRDTSAIIRILGYLGGRWGIAAFLVWLVPGPIRDVVYRLAARNRYRLFGRRPACAVPPVEFQHRFMS